MTYKTLCVYGYAVISRQYARALVVVFLLFPVVLPSVPARGGERELLVRVLAEAGVSFRESIVQQAGFFTETDGAWVWVELGSALDDGSIQSPDLLPSGAPVLGIPFDPARDSIGPAAAAALALLRYREEAGETAPLSLVFYDPRENRGLLDFSEALEDPEETRLLLLDLREEPEPSGAPGRGADAGLPARPFTIYQGTRSTVAPLAMTRLLAELLERAGLPYDFAIRYNELYKLGIARGPESLETTKQYGIPALALSGVVSPVAGAPATGESAVLVELLDRFLSQVQIDPGNADLHYSMYNAGGLTVFVPEQSAVFLIIVVNGIFLAFLLASFLVRRVHMLFLLKTGFSHLWVSLLYFFGLFLCMMAANAFVLPAGRFLSSLFQRAGLLPGVFFAGLDASFLALLDVLLAALAAVSLFMALPIPLLAAVPLVKRGGFYGFTGLLAAAIAMLLGIYLDITTAHFFACILVFVALGMISEKPVLSLLFTLLTLVRPLFVLWSAAKSGNGEALLAGSVMLRSVAAVIILFPSVTGFMRALVLVIPRRGVRQRVFHPVRAAALIFCVLLILFRAFLSPGTLR